MPVAEVKRHVDPVMPRERLELILNQLDQLPTLPTVVSKLLSVTSSNESCADDVVEILESDAALTASVLRLLQRSDLGVRTQDSNVSRAVTLLGFRAVRNSVLSLAFFEAFSDMGDDVVGSHRLDLWKHNVAVACAAEMLAEVSRHRALVGDAFACGLLHDIGKIALDACFPKSYGRVLSRVDKLGECISTAERTLFGVDHTIAGKRLATKWQLPQPVLECIWLHHQQTDALPSSVANPQLIRVVHMADSLVRRHAIGYSGYRYVGDIEGMTKSLGLSHETVEEVVARLPSRMEPFMQLLGLDSMAEQTLSTQALLRANRELGRLNTSLVRQTRDAEAQQTFLEALRCFADDITPRAGIEEVCKAATRCIRKATGSKSVVAFVREPRSGCVHAGMSTEPAYETQTCILEKHDARACVELLELAQHAAPGTVISSIPTADTVWVRLSGQNPDQPLHLLSIPSGKQVIGGILIPASEMTAKRWANSRLGWESLLAGLGMAMSSAHAKADAEQMSEELLDSHRSLRDAQQELIRARSISMIAEMAAGAAHEMNNPLAVISGRAQMQLAECDDPQRIEGLEIIIEHTKRTTQIVTELMNFAKPTPPNPLHQGLEEMLKPLCQHWKTSLELTPDQLTLQLTDPSVSLYADIGQISQTLGALIANAAQATTHESRRIKINSPSTASDETVLIVVEDNGAGMQPDVVEHAFDPFYSHRPAGRGRGLGLSRAYRLVEINGGKLWLNSKPDVGTKVFIELPARAPSA